LTAAPIVLLMFLALCVILILLNRPEVRRISGADEYVTEERRRLGGISAGKRNTIIAFAVAVTLWILPGIVNLIFGENLRARDLFENPPERGGRGDPRRVAPLPPAG
jgi:sodium-dependent dicarboxylate transporter 2/3/5